MNNNNTNIILVESDEALANTAKVLCTKSIISFDTEFDRFWRGYGFKMFLLQIYDGEICYLIDPLGIKNMQPLWQVFENENICKVAYACSEDVQLLKINNCHTKNIFDVQISAKLCNHISNSFADLILDEYDITLDKSLQRSNWSTRPLTSHQLQYASNDVIWLIQLHKKFTALALANGVSTMLAEENKLCEAVAVAEYKVKLTSKQKAKYSPYHQQILLSIFMWRDAVAEAYNLPPFQISSDDTLENVLENTNLFLNQPFIKGFCRRLLDDNANQHKLLNIIENIDGSKPNIPLKKERLNDTVKLFYTDAEKAEIDNKCKALQQKVASTYGNTAADYILRGFRKNILSTPFNDIFFRKYQQQVIAEHSEDLGIIF